MKFFLISDNIDTKMGMRIAGIEGVVAHTADEVSKALSDAVADKNIAVVLITEICAKLCTDKVYDIKLNLHRPLIVEIPDRHGSKGISEAMSRYIEESIGIKL